MNFNLIHSHAAVPFFIEDDCDWSFDCDTGAYCVFNGGESGTSVKCTDLNDKKCEDDGFIDAEDEKECKAVCEGQ